MRGCVARSVFGGPARHGRCCWRRLRHVRTRSSTLVLSRCESAAAGLKQHEMERGLQCEPNGQLCWRLCRPVGAPPVPGHFAGCGCEYDSLIPSDSFSLHDLEVRQRKPSNSCIAFSFLRLPLLSLCDPRLGCWDGFKPNNCVLPFVPFYLTNTCQSSCVIQKNVGINFQI